MKKKNRWIKLGKALIIVSTFVLIINAYAFFEEIRRDISYADRCYGVTELNEHFDNGEYFDIYEKTCKNKLTDEKPEVDVSQYEAFGRYYYNYLMANTVKDNVKYLEQMEKEKSNITWTKILDVIDTMKVD